MLHYRSLSLKKTHANKWVAHSIYMAILASPLSIPAGLLGEFEKYARYDGEAKVPNSQSNSSVGQFS
jgi:hypothetical protein